MRPSQGRQNTISLPEWNSLEEISHIAIFEVLTLNKDSKMFLIILPLIQGCFLTSYHDKIYLGNKLLCHLGFPISFGI